jgi:hypothetical protein
MTVAIPTKKAIATSEISALKYLLSSLTILIDGVEQAEFGGDP